MHEKVEKFAIKANKPERILMGCGVRRRWMFVIKAALTLSGRSRPEKMLGFVGSSLDHETTRIQTTGATDTLRTYVRASLKASKEVPGPPNFLSKGHAVLL